MTTETLQILCRTAAQAAQEAGQYIQEQFAKPIATEYKAGGSSVAAQVVTEVDRRAQEIILAHLADSISRYDLGLLTEEAVDDRSRLEKENFWCVDPMDGTLAFTERRPGYAVSIALVTQAGDPVIGVVYLPDQQACYTAIQGQGVQLNEKPFLKKSAPPIGSLNLYLDQSFTQAPYFETVQTQLNAWAKRQEIPQLEYHTGYGAVRNAIAVMHCQRGGYFKFPKPQPGGGSLWDYAATRLLFEEFGNVVSDAHGQPLRLNNPATTFMNQTGVLYATDAPLAQFLVQLSSVR